MTEKDTNELAMYAREMFPEKTDQEISDAIKIIYTIGTLL